MTRPVPSPVPPPELQVPKLRFWGDRKPPKNRVDMFSVRVQNAGESDASTSSGTAETGTTATMRLYGPVDSWGGWFGISAQDVATALDSLDDDVTEIRVRINSPGGEVWEGTTILNMFRAHPARIVAVVDGLAASAASVIATGCDETVMSPGTQLMVHDASAFAYGPEATMLKAARFLASTSDAIASVYSEAAGGTDAEWRAAMIAETWYTAKEAVAAGLADRVAVVPDAGQTETAGDEPDLPDTDTVEDRFDLSIFNHAGRSHAPAPTIPPAASADGNTTTQEGSSAVAFTDEQIATMRQELGLPEDADEAAIVAALPEALAERADPASTNVPAGHVVVPSAKLRDLEAGAAAGISAARNLHERERKEVLDTNRSKYAPANRAAWESEYDRDPKGTAAYFATAPELIPVGEIGHGAGDEATDASDSLAAVTGSDTYKNWSM